MQSSRIDHSKTEVGSKTEEVSLVALESAKTALTSIGNTIFVALDAKSTDAAYAEFEKLNAYEKIDRLMEKIEFSYQELLAKEKEINRVIIATREFTLSDSNSRLLTNQAYKLFKQRMLELTKKHDKLIIVSGGCLMWKEVTPDKLDKVKARYQLLEELINYEKQIKNEAIKAYVNMFNKLDKTAKSLIELTNKGCVFFQGSMTTHDKSCLHDEINEGKNFRKNTAYFRPGSKETMNSIIKIDGEFYGFEICRETFHGILSRQLSKLDIPIDLALHIISSASVSLNFNNLPAKKIAYLDKYSGSTFIVSGNSDNAQENNIKFYQCDVLTKNKLTGPIVPINPLQLKIKWQLSDQLKMLPKQPSPTPLFNQVNQLYNNIVRTLPKVGANIPIDSTINLHVLLMLCRMLDQDYLSHDTARKFIDRQEEKNPEFYLTAMRAVYMLVVSYLKTHYQHDPNILQANYAINSSYIMLSQKPANDAIFANNQSLLTFSHKRSAETNLAPVAKQKKTTPN